MTNPANRKSDFLKKTVCAPYSLDPPTRTISDCLNAARIWAKGDQRYRFYKRAREIHTSKGVEMFNSHTEILVTKTIMNPGAQTVAPAALP